ncbi:hypothetical protein C0992_007950 [Termitomyces sp. T32_za158]|nr:hypothetical protein C0992_007950 [Termitomyces sp. T32_za158]
MNRLDDLHSTEHHGIQPCLRERAVARNLGVQPFLVRHNSDSDRHPNHDTDKRRASHSSTPPADYLECEWERKEQKNDGLRNHHDERTGNSHFEGLDERLSFKFTESPIPVVSSLLAQSLSFLAQNGRSKCLGHDEREKETSGYKDEEDPIDPAPTGILADPTAGEWAKTWSEAEEAQLSD